MDITGVYNWCKLQHQQACVQMSKLCTLQCQERSTHGTGLTTVHVVLHCMAMTTPITQSKSNMLSRDFSVAPVDRK